MVHSSKDTTEDRGCWMTRTQASLSSSTSDDVDVCGTEILVRTGELCVCAYMARAGRRMFLLSAQKVLAKPHGGRGRERWGAVGCGSVGEAEVGSSRGGGKGRVGLKGSRVGHLDICRTRTKKHACDSRLTTAGVQVLLVQG